MFENPRRGRQAKNLPKILDIKSSSEQIFSENCRWVSLLEHHTVRVDQHLRIIMSKPTENLTVSNELPIGSKCSENRARNDP